jgi:hypothetical protein
MRRLWFPLAVLAGALGLAAAQDAMTPKTPADDPDAVILRQAKLDPNDGPQLVAYLKQRTISDSAQDRIQALIKQFAADDFETRRKAADEVAEFGPAAEGPLKVAERDRNPEVAYRAALARKKLSTVNHAAVAVAAARNVARLRPTGAAGALLGFLPMADSEALAADIRAALVALASRNGEPEPTLLAALADPSPVRRAAAYVALVEGGPATERIRIKAAFGPVKDAVRKDPDPTAKFAGVCSLLLTTREKEFVPDLIALLPDVPRGRAWQVEDLLLQVAGGFPAGAQLGKTPEAVAKARDAWAAWWAAKGGDRDLTKLDLKTRVRGLTELVEDDRSGLGRGRVVQLGPDLRERWRLQNPSLTPTDARSVSDDRVLVAEFTSQRVTERDLSGQALTSRQVLYPIAVEPLPGGRAWVVGRQGVVELDKDGGNVWSFARNQADVWAGCRLPNGDTLLVTNVPQGPNAFRIDAKGKDTGRSYTLGRVQGYQTMAATGDDAVLLCEAGQVVEYDLATQKAVWRHTFANPTSVQRLTNGNTLIASQAQNRVVEVTPDGVEVWEYTSKDNVRPTRAYRR